MADVRLLNFLSSFCPGEIVAEPDAYDCAKHVLQQRSSRAHYPRRRFQLHARVRGVLFDQGRLGEPQPQGAQPRSRAHLKATAFGPFNQFGEQLRGSFRGGGQLHEFHAGGFDLTF